MNRVFKISILLLHFSLSDIFCQDKNTLLVQANFNHCSFEEFSNGLSENYNLLFYYNPEWVQSLIINIHADNIPLEDLLEKIFMPSFCGFTIVNDTIVVVLPDKMLITKLPSYTNSETVKINKNNTEEITEFEQKYLKGRQPDMVETIIIGDYAPNNKNNKVTINGKLTNIQNGEPLIGATIYLKKINLGKITDVNGSVTLSVKPGKYETVFQCLGMTTINCIVDVKSGGYFNLQMNPQVNSIEEVKVTSHLTNTRSAKTGLENLSIKTIKELPTLMGEKDVMKIAQMLPGVVSVSEGAAGVNVRGSNADQNLFYLNTLPVYNSSHLFGFFSAVNTNIINNFSIYKAHVPAQFGGRLASVFQVEPKKGNKKNFFAQGGISPISAQISSEIPVIQEKASVLLSARSSYSNWILKKMDDPDLRNSRASFNDFTIGFNYDINKNNKFDFIAYRSYDRFNLNDLADYNYANNGLALNYYHWFTPAFKAGFTALYSNYNSEIKDISSVSGSYRLKYNLDHKEMKIFANWMANEKFNVNTGISAILYNLDRGMVEPYGEESKMNYIDLGNEQALESAAWLDNTYTPVYWLELYTGLRYSYYEEFGPKTVYSYIENEEKSNNTIIDSTYYASGNKIASYNNPEIRLAADFKLNTTNSVKMSYTQMSQYLFMLSNTVVAAPSDQWKLADSFLSPPRSQQISIGYFTGWQKAGVKLSIEGYYKKAKNILDYKDGADFVTTSQTETMVLQGEQIAWGCEFMLSKDIGNFTGWLSYTWSRSFMQIDGDESWEKINKGKKYPSNYDKPHVVNLILNYRLNKRIIFSSVLAYSTGRPITLPQSIFYINGNPYIDYSDRNAYRIPDYFRTDLSLTLEGNLKRNKPIHSYWVFSVYNLTGRKNPYTVYFKSENSHIVGYQYAVIGVPVFTATWNFKLGNYANN